MTRVAIALVAISGLLLPQRANAARSPIEQSLPAGAHLLSQVTIEGQPGYIGVTYLALEPFVGVVRTNGAKPRLLWSHALPLAGHLHPDSGHPDVVEGSGDSTTSARAEIFAYRVVNGVVTSAVVGHPHGIVVGDEGAKFDGGGFKVARGDAAHVGSVPYVLVAAYRRQGDRFTKTGDFRRPLASRSGYPRPNATVKTMAGDTILLKLEVAASEAARETGLMNRGTLDPDSGMVFAWDQPVHESFWMENTFIPLSIAFLGADGTVQEIQEMTPLSLDLHTPAADYQYAIEANKGFFTDAGIRVGDRMQLDLAG